MARLHFVQRAAKTYRGTGIRKGKPYYWYKHRRGPKVRSLSKPPRSAYLTTSAFIAEMMDLEDEFQGSHNADEWRDIAERVRSAGEDCREKRDAMEGSFPSGCPTMELLETRAEACEQIAGDIESAIDEIDSGELDENGCDNCKASVNWEYE